MNSLFVRSKKLIAMNISKSPTACIEGGVYKTKKFTPREVGLPLLLKNKVKTDQLRLNKHIRVNLSLYAKPENIRVVTEKDTLQATKCQRMPCSPPASKFSRDLAKFRSWNLAPNRYSIKGRDVADIVKRQTGTKGPFYSGTLRNDDSIYGHLKLSQTCGANTFYNIPSMSDLLNRYYNKNKMKFSTASRNRKPYLRFMVNDLVLCWRDPDDPSPAHYFPKNHSLEKTVAKPVKSKPITIFNFLPNSSVPARETSFVKAIDTSTPGPGRYETIEIACPCQNKLIVKPGIWREIELEKRKRYRHLKYKCIKEEVYCPCSKVRNIRGHGHTYVFNSKSVRLVERMPVAKKMDRLAKMHHTKKYIQMIVNPRRIPISRLRIGMTPKPAKLTFNSLVKSKIRFKLHRNKRIAFLSATPRFKDDEKSRTFTEPSRSKDHMRIRRLNLSRESKSDRHITIESRESAYKRLQALPSRFQQKQIATRKKVFKFSPIPKPQLLLKESDIITRVASAEFFQASCNIKDFLKDEYRRPSTLDGLKPGLPHDC